MQKEKIDDEYETKKLNIEHAVRKLRKKHIAAASKHFYTYYRKKFSLFFLLKIYHHASGLISHNAYIRCCIYDRTESSGLKPSSSHKDWVKVLQQSYSIKELRCMCKSNESKYHHVRVVLCKYITTYTFNYSK